MKKGVYIMVLGVILLLVVLVTGYMVLEGLKSMGNPTGGRGAPDYPYFITTEELTIKKIVVPKGTKLTYEKHFFKKGQQDKIMSGDKLTDIELPKGETIDWGGVPVYMIVKFFNPKMQGYAVYADFDQLQNYKKTKFSELWQKCNDDGVEFVVFNPDDWTFNLDNINEVSNCDEMSGLFQRK